MVTVSRFVISTLLFVIITFGIQAQTNNYFGASGALNGSVWSTSPGGPYTSPFDATGGGIANFGNVANFTGGSITVAGINATANATLTSPSGTISNFNNGIISINVASGVTLDFAGQAFTNVSSAGYIKDGDGVLALTGAAYGGGFTLNAGTVIVRGNNALGSSATNTLILNGGVLASNSARDLTGKFGAGITIGGNVQFGDVIGLASSSATLTFSNNMSLGSTTRTLTLGNSATMTFGGVITNSSNVGITFSANANGTGRFDITNTANLYSGTTTIAGAEARFSADGSLGAVPGAVTSDSIVLDGGRLGFLGGASFTLNANRGIQVSGSSANGINVPSAGSTITYNGVISDKPSTTGSWVKSGAGILLLGGANTYSGSTTINLGTVRLTGGSDRLPTSTVVYLGSTTNTLGTLDLNGQNQTITGLNSISGTATGANKNTVTSSTPATLTISGSGNYSFSNNTPANSGIITGAISLVMNGNGTQFLGDLANTYSGKTTINNGFLAVNSAGSFGQNPGSLIADQITLNGGGIRAQSTAVDFNSNRGFTLGVNGGTFDSNGQGISIWNVITGSGNLTKIGTNNLSLIAANTYAGATNLENGSTFAYGGDNRLPASTVLTLGSGTNSGILALGHESIGGPINQTITGLTTSGTGTGNAVVGNTATGKSTLTVNNAANYSFDGKLGGTGNQNNLNLVKSGPGTLTLSGNNSYTGTTTVNGGTLLVNGSHSSSDTYTINGGTLGGTGAINADVTVFSANLAPGSSTGILTINGNVTLSSTSTFAVELNGITPGTGYDQLAVGSSGALDLGGASLQLSLGFAPLSTDKFFIIANQSGAIANTFDNLPDLSTITIGSYTGNITYFGDLLSNALTGGNDVVIYNLVSIPEPSTFLLIGLAGFFGAQWYLRRKPAENKNDKLSENASTESTPAEPAI